MLTRTPCPGGLVRCAPVVSPVDKFSEIGTPVLIYASLTNKLKRFLPWS